MIDLDGRIVLITGGGRRHRLGDGPDPRAAGGTVLAPRRPRRVGRAAGEGDWHQGPRLIADLADPVAAGRLWTDALAVHGRIDVLVNNAGIYPAAELDSPLDEWVRVWNLSLAVNLVAPAILCRAAVAAFSGQPERRDHHQHRQPGGVPRRGPGYWHYAAAKAGIVAMTRTIARQNGRQGVTAFAIAPGYVDTAFNQRFADEVGVEVAARDTGLGEVAQPQDVANVVVFLASGLARHATGTTIDVNGASYVR